MFLAEYKEAFSLFDDQGDGKIEPEQIGSLLRSLNLNPDDEDIVKIEKDVGELLGLAFAKFRSDRRISNRVGFIYL